MSECFICQRTEGVVELPLGPFCVQCIKEIQKHGASSEVHKTRRHIDWEAMWRYLASSANKETLRCKSTEWEKYFASAASTANSRANEQPKRDARKKGRTSQALSWSEFWSKRAYEAAKRPVYILNQSEWNKKWANTARMIYSRHRAKLPQNNVECE